MAQNNIRKFTSNLKISQIKTQRLICFNHNITASILSLLISIIKFSPLLIILKSDDCENLSNMNDDNLLDLRLIPKILRYKKQKINIKRRNRLVLNKVLYKEILFKSFTTPTQKEATLATNCFIYFL